MTPRPGPAPAALAPAVVTALLVALLAGSAPAAATPTARDTGPPAPVTRPTGRTPPTGSPAAGLEDVWRAPVDPPVLDRRFAAPATRWGPGHRGVDLVASPGTSVRAPSGGTVTFVGRVVDRDVVTIAHPDGLRSSLEPVAATVAEGAVVQTGDVVGATADGGHCGRACVHWGVRRGTEYLDPLTLLGGGPVVLLPLDG